MPWQRILSECSCIKSVLVYGCSKEDKWKTKLDTFAPYILPLEFSAWLTLDPLFPQNLLDIDLAYQDVWLRLFHQS